MMNGVVNRIAGLLEDEPVQTSTQRSPKQRKASRANGSSSHGPRTEAGKLKSSQNSLKHGLTSQRFAPPFDVRGDDTLFRRIQRELTDEFQPKTFTARETVDALAFDLVQVARARAMAEALQRPAPVPTEDLECWQRFRVARRDLKTVKQLLARLDAGKELGCSPKAALRFARNMAESVEALHEYMHPKEEVTPPDQMDKYEREEYDQYQSRWLMLQPIKKKLLDQDYMASVARGMTHVGVGERRRLRHAMEMVRLDLQRVFNMNTDLEARMSKQQDQALLDLARSPNGLLLNRRYIARIERAIDRKMKELRRT
jgi:hypothetical protein